MGPSLSLLWVFISQAHRLCGKVLKRLLLTAAYRDLVVYIAVSNDSGVNTSSSL